MKITLHDKIPDTDVLHLTGMTSFHTMISKNKLQWSGHVVRMTGYQNASSTENLQLESDPWVDNSSATKTS